MSTYGATPGLANCTNCPRDATTTDVGSTSLADCLCEAGYVGEIVAPVDICDPCARDTFKGVAGDTFCAPCPPGSIAPELAATQCQCLPGTFPPECSGVIRTPSDRCENCTDPVPAPPPPPPPPAPKRCFERGTQNLRLHATESVGSADQTDVSFATTTSKYVSEGATGNWAAHSITAGNPLGHVAGSRRGASCNAHPVIGCSGVGSVFNKVMYVAASKRTFTIFGNVSSNGAVVYTQCESVPGEDLDEMARSHLAMGFIFGAPAFGAPDMCTVGKDGIFDFALEAQRVGAVSFGAYGSSQFASRYDPLPGRVLARLLVDESDDNFIPVSIEIASGGTSEIFNSMFFMYDDWTNDDTPIPEEVWDIPDVCFSRSDPSTQIWREASLEREPGVSLFRNLSQVFASPDHISKP